MPENTSIIFFDEYKKLDKLCSEMYGKNSGGVTCYLNDMMAVPVMQRNRIPEWNQTYDRLRELRHIRNQMAHGESSFEDYPCSEEDVLWLFEFRSKIMHISDPLAVYRRQTEGSTHATRAKGEHQLAVDHWQTEESMHAARAKEDFLLAVDQSQTERNIADYQRIKMDNVEVIKKLFPEEFIMCRNELEIMRAVRMIEVRGFLSPLKSVILELPDMDGGMQALTQQTLSKLERMTDADYGGQKFHFTYENE